MLVYWTNAMGKARQPASRGGSSRLRRIVQGSASYANHPNSNVLLTTLPFFPFLQPRVHRIKRSTHFKSARAHPSPGPYSVRISITYLIDAETDASGVGSQITQAASGDAFERLLSRTIFWSYCILTPITTIVYVVLGLWLTRL